MKVPRIFMAGGMDNPLYLPLNDRQSSSFESLVPGPSSSESDNETEDAGDPLSEQRKVRLILRQLLQLTQNGQFELASALMTTDGQINFLIDTVASCLVYSTILDEEEETSEARETKDEIRTLTQKFNLPSHQSGVTEDNFDEWGDSFEQIEKDITDVFRSRSDRWEIVEPFFHSFLKFDQNPFYGEILSSEILGQVAYITIKLHNTHSQVEPPQILVHRMIRRGKTWRYDGIDEHRTEKSQQ